MQTTYRITRLGERRLHQGDYGVPDKHQPQIHTATTKRSKSLQRQVTYEEYASNWDQAFGPKKDK